MDGIFASAGAKSCSAFSALAKYLVLPSRVPEFAERANRRAVAGGDCVVGAALRAVQQNFVIVRGEKEAAGVSVFKMLQHRVADLHGES